MATTTIILTEDIWFGYIIANINKNTKLSLGSHGQEKEHSFSKWFIYIHCVIIVMSTIA